MGHAGGRHTAVDRREVGSKYSATETNRNNVLLKPFSAVQELEDAIQNYESIRRFNAVFNIKTLSTGDLRQLLLRSALAHGERASSPEDMFIRRHPTTLSLLWKTMNL
jgi:hypothetical protein